MIIRHEYNCHGWHRLVAISPDGTVTKGKDTMYDHPARLSIGELQYVAFSEYFDEGDMVIVGRKIEPSFIGNVKDEESICERDHCVCFD